MYWIICIIRATALRTVKDKLNDIGCIGMTISECEGMGRQKGHSEQYRGAEYKFSLVPKVKLEIACTQGELNLALQAIREGGKTGADGSIGDGKIFVFQLGEVVRIRTGERGKQVI